MGLRVQLRLSPGRCASARTWALAAAAAVLLTASVAHGYCRSTTCSGNCATNADGCKTDGESLWWPTICVGFSLQQDGSQNVDFTRFSEVVQASFVAWSDHVCADGGYATMAFTQQRNVACHKAEYNPDGANANIILFQDTRWDYEGAGNDIAKTTVSYDNGTGEILDADIELNHAYNEFTLTDDPVVYDLQSIVTHEIGHFIGFDHTSDPSATMNASYQQGSVDRRSIEQDDIAALCAAYPSNRTEACAPKPYGGFSGECADGTPDDDEEAAGCTITAASANGTSPWALFTALTVLAGLRRQHERMRR